MIFLILSVFFFFIIYFVSVFCIFFIPINKDISFHLYILCILYIVIITYIHKYIYIYSLLCPSVQKSCFTMCPVKQQWRTCWGSDCFYSITFIKIFANWDILFLPDVWNRVKWRVLPIPRILKSLVGIWMTLIRETLSDNWKTLETSNKIKWEIKRETKIPHNFLIWHHKTIYKNNKKKKTCS